MFLFLVTAYFISARVHVNFVAFQRQTSPLLLPIVSKYSPCLIYFASGDCLCAESRIFMYTFGLKCQICHIFAIMYLLIVSDCRCHPALILLHYACAVGSMTRTAHVRPTHWPVLRMCVRLNEPCCACSVPARTLFEPFIHQSPSSFSSERLHFFTS